MSKKIEEIYDDEALEEVESEEEKSEEVEETKEEMDSEEDSCCDEAHDKKENVEEDDNTSEDKMNEHEEYTRVKEIAEKAMEIRKEVSEDIAEQASPVFVCQDDIYTKFESLGEAIQTGKSNDRESASKIMEAFNKKVDESLEKFDELFEATYKLNAELSKITIKPSYKVSEINESVINEVSEKYQKVNAYIKKLTKIFEKHVETVESHKKKIDEQILVLEKNTLCEDTIKGDFWCVYQPGAAIFGVGKTEKEAWDDAEEWADTTDENWKNSFKASECTEDLYNYVNKNGSPDDWEEYDGIMALPDEVENLNEAIDKLYKK